MCETHHFEIIRKSKKKLLKYEFKTELRCGYCHYQYCKYVHEAINSKTIINIFKEKGIVISADQIGEIRNSHKRDCVLQE